MKETKQKIPQYFPIQALLNHEEHSPSPSACVITAEVLFIVEACALLVNDLVIIARNNDTTPKCAAAAIPKPPLKSHPR